jgi:dienelactone hydrolase
MPPPPLPSILIATDIFGHTPEVQALARQIGAAARIVSPYGDERPRFGSEMEAYAAFSARTSIEKYAGELAAQLHTRPLDLALGFSVGATALWLCLAKASPWLPRQATLYYGSRIRQYTDRAPQCPTRLVFAEKETSFDALELTTRLRSQGLDAVVIPGSAHGFMNSLSSGFDLELTSQELAAIKTQLG